jgi:hypothetical protein
MQNARTTDLLRNSALYLSPLVDAMEQYAARDAAGAKMAGGRGIPKRDGSEKAAARNSPLYKYVEEVQKGIAAVSAGAKAGDFAAVSGASASIKKAATSFLAEANAPVIFN